MRYFHFHKIISPFLSTLTIVIYLASLLLCSTHYYVYLFCKFFVHSFYTNVHFRQVCRSMIANKSVSLYCSDDNSRRKLTQIQSHCCSFSLHSKGLDDILYGFEPNQTKTSFNETISSTASQNIGRKLKK